MNKPQLQLRFPILILLPILIPSLSVASHTHPTPPDPQKALKEIHKKFKVYESQREEMKKISLESASQPAGEGSRAYVYKGRLGQVRIIDESYFAEVGQATWSYYFDGKKPFYVLVAETKYAYPITVSAADRKKLGGGEDKTTESRYYFKGGKLIRWLEGKKPVPTRSERFRDQAKSMLELADSAYRNALRHRAGGS